jgi:hypothetical protein
MATYKNKFYSKHFQNSTPFITVNEAPVIYRGYEIYKRFSNLFDIVKNGVCVGMCAGLNGAKRRIDAGDLNTPGAA